MVFGGPLAVGRKERDQLAPLGHGKAGADANMLQRTACVIQAEQQGTDRFALAILVPAEAGHHAVAVALVLDLQHGAFVRLVDAVDRLRHHAVQARAFKALKPVGGDRAVASGGRLVDGRRGLGQHLAE